MFTLIFWIIYLSGVIYTAPIFAAEEAHRRGRIRVHTDDAVIGASRSALWFIFYLTTYAQKAGDKKLAKLPDVRHARALEAGRMSDSMDHILNPSSILENDNSKETLA